MCYQPGGALMGNEFHLFSAEKRWKVVESIKPLSCVDVSSLWILGLLIPLKFLL